MAFDDLFGDPFKIIKQVEEYNKKQKSLVEVKVDTIFQISETSKFP